MKAYVQSQHGQWLNDNCYTVWYGLTRMGYNVHPFSMDNLPDDMDKTIFTHGGINTIRKVFDKIGTTQPPIHNPHEHLPEFCNREFVSITMGQVKTLDKFPYFIKPEVDHKLFTGFVVNNWLDKNKLKQYPDDTKVLVSEVIDIVSEYRCFVNRRTLVGSKNYTGDFTKNIDYDVVTKAIEVYKLQPISYSLDFALTKKGETLLIEINDGFALGSYGLNPITYTKMMMDRWSQITNS